MPEKTVLETLQGHYPLEQCVIMEEVSNSTGHSRSRSLDFMVMNLWNSRGIHLTGIELKSWRGDWLKELKNPAKQEDHFRYCDFFYLLTSKEDVAKLEEIPDKWGWMIISKGRIVIKKQAPLLSPIPVSKDFLACLIRRADKKDGYVLRSSIEATIEQRVEIQTRSLRRDLDSDRANFEEVMKKVREFQIATGLEITTTRYRWNQNHRKIGEFVNLLINSDPQYIVDKIKNIKKQLDEIHSDLDKNVQLIDKIINEE